MMKMVIQERSGSRSNMDIQLAQYKTQMCLCLVCTVPQPIIISMMKVLFNLAMHTVDNSMCVFLGAGTFNTKYIHYLKLYLLSSSSFTIVIIIHFEYSEYIKWNRMVKQLNILSYCDTQSSGEKKEFDE